MKKWIRAVVAITLAIMFGMGAVIPLPTQMKEETGMSVEAGQQTEQQLQWVSSVQTLKAGKSKTFQVNSDGAVWTSSKPKIASVDSTGKVKALRYGKTVISAEVGQKKISADLTVTPKKVIGIDPGHQKRANSGPEPIGPGASEKKIKVAGGASGAVSGLAEYQLTLAVSKELKKVLKDRGYKVVMTRTKHNVNISNKQRALKLNKSCDIAVRIHGDSYTASSSGASVLYPSKSNPYVGELSSKSKKLSKCILKSYCKKTKIKRRGLSVRNDLTGTNWSTIPVTLIELGFMSNPEEDRYMAKKSNQKIMAKGIADGIDKYFKK